jgi:hypothetical protein
MIMRNVHKRAAVLGVLTAAVAVATASGAHAEPTTSPEGIGIAATGAVPVPPTPDATSATPSPATVAAAGVGAILSASDATASVSGTATNASVAGISAPLGSVLPISAGWISSWCTANSDGTFGLGSDTGSLSVAGVTIPADPPPNTRVRVPGAATIILNEQVARPGAGSETATAVHISLLTGENIFIASSTCRPFTAPAAMGSGKGLAIGLGTIGVAGAAVTAVTLSRRRRLVAD